MSVAQCVRSVNKPPQKTQNAPELLCFVVRCLPWQVYDKVEHPADVTEEWQLVSSASARGPAPEAFAVSCQGISH